MLVTLLVLLSAADLFPQRVTVIRDRYLSTYDK